MINPIQYGTGTSIPVSASSPKARPLNPSLPAVSYPSDPSCVVVPATLLRQNNGALGLSMRGASGAAILQLTGNAAKRLQKEVNQGRLPAPDIPLETQVHVNLETGDATWRHGVHDFALKSDKFTEHFKHLSQSFVEFIRSALPSETLANLEKNQDHSIRQDKLIKLPTEVLQNFVGTLLPVGTLVTMAGMGKAYNSVFMHNLHSLEDLAFAGKKTVRDENGNLKIGDDGMPLREYPPALTEDGKPVLDANGNVTRNVPELTHAHYEKALGELEWTLHPMSFRQAAWNTLNAAFLENPLPEYQPQIHVSHTQNGVVDNVLVTFPESLAAALRSTEPMVRDWAALRFLDVYNRDESHTYLEFRVTRAMEIALLQVENYEATVKSVTTNRGVQTRRIEYGEFHKSLFHSPHDDVRKLATKLAERAAAVNRITFRVNEMNKHNEVYKFPLDTKGGKKVATVPDVFNAWLLPLPFKGQALNMIRLAHLMFGVGNRPPDYSARGYAQYLVRNIVHWPADRIARLLTSNDMLHVYDGALIQARAEFVKQLTNKTANRKIPEEIIDRVEKRLLIAAKNRWVNASYGQPETRTPYDIVHLLTNWASKRDIDLAELAESDRSQLQAEVDLFLSENSARPQALSHLVKWLPVHAHGAPQS